MGKYPWARFLKVLDQIKNPSHKRDAHWLGSMWLPGGCWGLSLVALSQKCVKCFVIASDKDCWAIGLDNIFLTWKAHMVRPLWLSVS